MIPKSNNYAVTLNNVVVLTGNKKDTEKYSKSHGGNLKGYQVWLCIHPNIGDIIGIKP